MRWPPFVLFFCGFFSSSNWHPITKRPKSIKYSYITHTGCWKNLITLLSGTKNCKGMRDFATPLDFSHLSQITRCEEGQHIHRPWAWTSPTLAAPGEAQVGNWNCTSSSCPSLQAEHQDFKLESCSELAFVARWSLLVWGGPAHSLPADQAPDFHQASSPSASWGCTGALCCLSCFTEGCF